MSSSEEQDGTRQATPGDAPVTRRKLIKGGAAVTASLAAAYIAPKVTSIRAQDGDLSPTPTPDVPPVPVPPGPLAQTPMMMLRGPGTGSFSHVVDFFPAGPSVEVRLRGVAVNGGPVTFNDLARIETEIIAMDLGGVTVGNLVALRDDIGDPQNVLSSLLIPTTAGLRYRAVTKFPVPPNPLGEIEMRHYDLGVRGAPYLHWGSSTPDWAEGGEVNWYYQVLPGDSALSIQMNSIGAIPPAADRFTSFELYHSTGFLFASLPPTVLPPFPNNFQNLNITFSPSAGAFNSGYWRLHMTGLTDGALNPGHHRVFRVHPALDPKVYSK